MVRQLAKHVAAVRRFNRYYTRELGLLRRHFLATPYTLGEMRVLFEIRERPGLTATDLGRVLDLDTAYMSRLISRFGKEKLVWRNASTDDARYYRLALTSAGLAAVKLADKRQAKQTEASLGRLRPAERKRLVAAMQTIEALLRKHDPPPRQADLECADDPAGTLRPRRRSRARLSR
jgi:DNA-binding MarR family transcriptional regulator